MGARPGAGQRGAETRPAREAGGRGAPGASTRGERASEAGEASGQGGQRPADTVTAHMLAVEGLREALRAAREDTHKLTAELSASWHEAGLWEGRARTLAERLAALEGVALLSGTNADTDSEPTHRPATLSWLV